MSVPYTDSEASEARQWSNRYGPPNAWTASFGTAARMIGRLLDERERLMAKQTVAAPGDDYIREWHDEFQRWKAVADAKQELRDQFAAAALNGLLARRDCYDHEIAALAWDMADAMLRERCRSGGDCPLPDNAPNLDAVPAAIAVSDEDRADKAATSHRRDRSGNTPVTNPLTNEKRSEVSAEPVAWGVLRVGGRWVSILDNAVQAETSRRSFDKMENWVHDIVPLYRSPALTDAERVAVEAAVGRSSRIGTEYAIIDAAVLRGFLERHRGVSE